MDRRLNPPEIPPRRAGLADARGTDLAALARGATDRDGADLLAALARGATDLAALARGATDRDGAARRGVIERCIERTWFPRDGTDLRGCVTRDGLDGLGRTVRISGRLTVRARVDRPAAGFRVVACGGRARNCSRRGV